MEVWLTPQQIAAMQLADMPKTERRVRSWAQKNLAVTRKRLRGKGIEIALSSLPEAAQQDYLARQAASSIPAVAPAPTFTARSGGSIPAGVPSPADSSPAATVAAGGAAGAGGAGGSFAVGDELVVPQGHHDGRAATAAADAGNGPLTRGAGSIPVARTTHSSALAGGAEYPATSSSFAGCAPALPAVAASSGAAGVFCGRTAALWEAFERRPASVQAAARARLAVCLDAKRLIDAGVPVTEAIKQAATAADVPHTTVRNWWYGKHGQPGIKDQPVDDWLPLLAPGYGAQIMREAKFSGAAWDWALAQYLRPERPSAARVYRDLLSCAPAQGWEVPSYASFLRRIKRIPWAVAVLAREGRRALLERMPALKRSVAHLQALEWVVADGHRFDVFVEAPARFGGGVMRPHLIAWQDVASRKILAWRLSPTLNAHSVQLCFAELVERYGIPDNALMDNGREFGAKALTGGAPWRFRFKVRADEPLGMLPMLGVEVHWATPFHGQAKPIERAFRDLCEEIAKDPRCAGAYTGNAPDAKPENYGAKAISWDAFEAVVAEGIARHNARSGRRTEMAAGRSFDEAFAQMYEKRTVRKLGPAQRAVLLLAAEGVTVRAGGSIELLGNRYGCPELCAFEGQRVLVRFDPDRLALPVRVYRLDGVFVTEAQPLLARFDDQLAAKAHARARRHAARAARAQLDAIRRMGEIEVAMPEPQDVQVARPAAVQVVPWPEKQDSISDAEAARYAQLLDAAVLDMEAARRAAG